MPWVAAVLGVLVTLSVIAFASVTASAAESGSGSGAAGALPVATKQLKPLNEKAALATLNGMRAAGGLGPLKLDNRLRLAARYQSTYVSQLGALTHLGPAGEEFWDRTAKAGYPSNRWLGETLALVPGCKPATSKLAVRGWLNSPEHRAIMMDARYKRVGIGVIAAAGCGQSAITADFGS